MNKIIENYLLQEPIGSGQYGKVYKATHMQTEAIFAVKVIKLQKFKVVPKLHEFTVNEIQTLSKISNPNVIRFVQMLRTSNNVYLVYQFCNGGTLEELIKANKFLSEKDALIVFDQIRNSFQSLFCQNILHRDLKPSNILLNDGVIKVADFGFCQTLLSPQDLTQTMVGSPIYMAPEILKGCNYNIQADIWSMGVVLFEMLFGYCPYEDKTIARLIGQIDNKTLVIPRHINNISKATEDIIHAMLTIDPNQRIEWVKLMSIKLIDENAVPTIPALQVIKDGTQVNQPQVAPNTTNQNFNSVPPQIQLPLIPQQQQQQQLQFPNMTQQPPNNIPNNHHGGGSNSNLPSPPPPIAPQIQLNYPQQVQVVQQHPQQQQQQQPSAPPNTQHIYHGQNIQLVGGGSNFNMNSNLPQPRISIQNQQPLNTFNNTNTNNQTNNGTGAPILIGGYNITNNNGGNSELKNQAPSTTPQPFSSSASGAPTQSAYPTNPVIHQLPTGSVNNTSSSNCFLNQTTDNSYIGPNNNSNNTQNASISPTLNSTTNKTFINMTGTSFNTSSGGEGLPSKRRETDIQGEGRSGVYNQTLQNCNNITQINSIQPNTSSSQMPLQNVGGGIHFLQANQPEFMTQVSDNDINLSSTQQQQQPMTPPPLKSSASTQHIQRQLTHDVQDSQGIIQTSNTVIPPLGLVKMIEKNSLKIPMIPIPNPNTSQATNSPKSNSNRWNNPVHANFSNINIISNQNIPPVNNIVTGPITPPHLLQPVLNQISATSISGTQQGSNSQTLNNQSCPTQQNPTFRYLIKERNKILYQIRVMNSVLEMNESESTPYIAFLILKSITNLTEKLKQMLEDGQVPETMKAQMDQRFETFRQSQEYKVFMQILGGELQSIQNCLEFFKDEIVKLKGQTAGKYENSSRGNSSSQDIHNKMQAEIQTNYIDKSFWKQLTISYFEQLNFKFDSIDQPTKQRLAIHQNQVLDCILMEDIYDQREKTNSKAHTPEYMLNLTKYQIQDLSEMANKKIQSLQNQ